MGDVSRSATVLYVHPEHSLVLLRLDGYPMEDPEPFGVDAIFEDKRLEAGDEVDFVGINARGQRFASKTTVQDVRLGEFPQHSQPRWREHNLEAVYLAGETPGTSSGVICDGEGKVHGLCTVSVSVDDGQVSRISYCVPTYALLHILEWTRGTMSTMCSAPSLGLELRAMELQRLRRLPARTRPTAEWLARLAAVGETALQVAGVEAPKGATGAAPSAISENDILVAIDGEVVSTAQGAQARLEEALAAFQAKGKEGRAKVKVTVLTKGKPRAVEGELELPGSDGARRLLCWHGLVLQETPRSVRLMAPVPSGVYISRTMLGSPAEAGGIEGDFVIAVDGVPTPTLDALLELDRRES
jgi:hypothetical protein